MALLEITLEIECRECKEVGTIKVGKREIEIEEGWQIMDGYYDEGSYLCKECFEKDD